MNRTRGATGVEQASGERPTGPERVVVGRIVSPHGLVGECVVDVMSDAPERFAPQRVLGAGDPDHVQRCVTVAAVRTDRGRLLVTFSEIRDRAAADCLRGLLLSIPVSDVRTPEDGTYYPHEIEGFAVENSSGTVLGTLADVIANPANDLWVVRTPEGRDVMVPAVRAFVRSVDRDRCIIVIDPIEGMFD